MTIVLLVGAGGLFGSVMRYVIGTWINPTTGSHWLPYGTLAVNVVGCLAIGLVMGYAETRNVLGENTRALLIVGLMGGFTTYSAFGYETVAMFRDGQTLAAAANVSLQLVLGLGAVWAGVSLFHSV